jgi:hypothetical protein
MRFKEFLFLEAGGDSGSDWFYGNSTYPSDAFDWPDQWTYPADFLFLQSRWKKERDTWGRKFHGLDPQSTIDNKFTSIESTTMPNNKNWKHKKDKRKNLKINNNANVHLMGVGKNSKVDPALFKVNNLLDKTDELNRIFGKFEPNFGNLSGDFDKNWSPYSGKVMMKKVKQKKWGKNQNNFPQKQV